MKKLIVKYTDYYINVIKFDGKECSWKDKSTVPSFVKMLGDLDEIDPNYEVSLEIDAESGKLLNHDFGHKIELYNKVVDEGTYTLFDTEVGETKTIQDYVIPGLDTYSNGYGDYIILDIDENGFIKGWDSDKILSNFIKVKRIRNNNHE